MDSLRINSVLYVIGLSLTKVICFLLAPLTTSLCTDSRGSTEFLATIIIATIPVVFFLRPGVKTDFDFPIRDVFLITCISWLIDCSVSALPFCFIMGCSYTDAFFETMSGLTTFGGTVFPELDRLPESLHLWRSMLQWIGGVGFIVIAVAILPQLNVGGMKMFRSEASEKHKDSPKAATVAKSILYVYIVLTAACTACYMACGMNFFESLCHAFTTAATGGFSTRDGSMAEFGPGAQWVCIVFMIIGSMPFLLYVKSLKRRDLGYVLNNQQVAGYIIFIIIIASVLMLFLWVKIDLKLSDAVRTSVFSVVSIITTSGFAVCDWTAWGPFATFLILLILPIGGCTGSTSGGIKFFRIQIINILFKKQCQELLHPTAIVAQSYDGNRIDDSLIRSVVAFFLSYIILLTVSCLLVCFDGVDVTVAVTSSISAISNVGPAYGDPAISGGVYQSMPTLSKWVMCFDMLCGRLEILTVIVLFVPRFWKATSRN